MLSVTTKTSESSRSGKQQRPKQQSLEEADESASLIKAPWNPWLGFSIAVLIFLGSQIISEVALSYYRYPRHWNQQQILNWLNNSVTAQFLFILIAEVLVVLAVLWFIHFYKNGMRTIGLRRPRWTDPLFGLSALPVYLVMYLLAVAIITHFVPNLNINEKQQLGFNNVSGAQQMILTFISLVILPPIAEEILFRGLIYSSLKKNLPTIVAVVGTSTIFAALHLLEGGSAGPLYIAGIDTFILSLVLIYLREKTGGIWSSMVLHALKNAIAFIALYAAYIR